MAARDRSVVMPVLATLWWCGYHLPRLLFKYHGVRQAKRLVFRLLLRRGREARLHSDAARRMVLAFRESQIAVSQDLLTPETVGRLGDLVDGCGCLEAVRRRKAEAEAGRIESPDYFHLSQEKLPPHAERRLCEILPDELVPVLELAHGRALRLYSVTYHETDPSDPQVRVGDSSYNAHPFHIDGNPKFAKLLLYLSDVDEQCGPFEVFPGSRAPLCEELLRLAYQEKHFRAPRLGALGRRLRPHLPACFRRDTHLWADDLGALVARLGAPPRRVLGKRGTLAFFETMLLHNGSRNQTRRREVLHFIFL